MSVMRTFSSFTALVLAALLAAGCGDDSSPKQSSDTDGPVKIRTVDAPDADEDLTDTLGTAGKDLVDAGCVFGTYELQEAEHVDEGKRLSDSFPPTTGKHYEDWAPFGIYDSPIEDGFVVHDLEHGGVAVWTGTKVPDADALVKALDDDYVDADEKWVIAPRRDIEGLFSAAWGKGLSCPPAAVTKLGTKATAEALDEWYQAVVSTGSEAEKDVPAYAGAMKEPTPERDISTEAPF
ncbi:MAG: hypothetical protein JWL76_1570 [Thermoleophilia bacterium]|nr:hypothetical protein [Thermoleophilia bacterium]